MKTFEEFKLYEYSKKYETYKNDLMWKIKRFFNDVATWLNNEIDEDRYGVVHLQEIVYIYDDIYDDIYNKYKIKCELSSGYREYLTFDTNNPQIIGRGGLLGSPYTETDEDTSMDMLVNYMVDVCYDILSEESKVKWQVIFKEEDLPKLSKVEFKIEDYLIYKTSNKYNL